MSSSEVASIPELNENIEIANPDSVPGDQKTAEVSAFLAMGLDSRLVDALDYKDPSPIQSQAIPPLLEGKDLVGLAGTGTGKTAAFALPILHRLRTAPTRKQGVSSIILVPTRELAIQVARAVKKYGKSIKVDVTAIYGGTGYEEQIRAIRRGVEVIVATPGRALDLIKRGKLPLDTISSVVLDEADEMLNMGFAEDMEAILAETPKDRQTMLFSATMRPRIEEIANRHLRDPIRIKVAKEVPASGEPVKVRQTAYVVTRELRAKALVRVLDIERPTSAIIFCRMRADADSLLESLTSRGFRTLALHGGLTQNQRDQVMTRFRSGSAELLVATDIAARGLDISHLSHVINFDVPSDPDQYIHRIGRVGRAGRAGVAITFAASRERVGLSQIERITKQKIEIAPIPTAKDLKASRVERMRLQLLEALTNLEDHEDLRKLVSELAEGSSPADVAVAALALLRQPSRPEDEMDFPVSKSPRDFQNERSRPSKFAGAGPRTGRDDHRDRSPQGRRPARGHAKIFFGVGREFGVLPRDLVAAIADRAGIAGRDIGAIDIAERFTLVEVPGAIADNIVEAMQGLRIRGRRVVVRNDRMAPARVDA